MASDSSVRFSTMKRVTFSEQPMVFSLKSSRNLSARPPVGGEYGAMLSTALRGLSFSVGIAHLNGAGVGFEPFGAGDGRDRRSNFREAGFRQFLHGDYLY